MKAKRIIPLGLVAVAILIAALLLRQRQEGQPTVTNVATPFGPLAGNRPALPQPMADLNPYPASGKVVVRGKTLTPANNSGQFQKVLVHGHEPVPVELTWPRGDTSESVWVQVVDGGSIDGEPAKLFSLKKSKTIHFTFQCSSNPGIYQVLLRRGTHAEALNFWVSTGIPSEPYAMR